MTMPREPFNWGPREELPGQLDLIPSLDAAIAAQEAETKAEAARHVVGGNGGPALEPAPDFAFLERVGKLIHGELWIGKLADELSEDPRQFRRWRDGQGVPTQRVMNAAKRHSLFLCMELLRAVGEPDLAEPLDQRIDRWNEELVERGRALHREKLRAARAAREKAASVA